MTQTTAAFAAGGWRVFRKAVQPSLARRTQSGERNCPVAIIARGVILLTVVGSCFGYALASISPSKAPAPFDSVAVRSDLPKPRAIVAWAPALKSLTPIDVPASTPGMSDLRQNARVRRTFLKLLQSALASSHKVLQFGPMRVKRRIVETIVRAAQVTHTDPVLLMAIADKESSFSTTAEARTSSAMGLFQFVDSTWLKAVRDFGAQFGLAKEASLVVGPRDRPTVNDAAERMHILNLRRDPYLSAVLAAEMLRRDSRKIAKRIGRGLTSGETYLAHFLGPDDAERFMEKVVGHPHFRAAVLLPRPARANVSLFYARDGKRAKQLSVVAVRNEFEKMMGLRLDRYRSIGAAAGLSAYADLDER